ncbi:protease complex subunit PrcB family protein [Clostridium sp. 'deep sea']|uniref:protease complex subunit PrcB family protein n=1 Tax=Clostridium sp. 'deep sea' TaxID=2779445 RepID=UPI0018967CE2|nr:protease complex subunit PrcB family protein [Clostridium sp. 'deep sea']QOR36776.1 protease complex subunit PrcB family protein [Clostridium sp. 'deep sea']
MKKLISVVLLIGVVMCLVLCKQLTNKPRTHPDADNFPTLLSDKKTEYTVINITDLERDQDKYWVESNKKEHGYKILAIYNEKSYRYLLISAGEMKTGGYSLEVTEVIEGVDKVTFKVKLNKPKKDSMVTMALTYPYLLLKVSASEKTIDVDFIDYKGSNGELIKVENHLKVEELNGIYSKRLDEKYISVKTTEESYMFKYSTEQESNTLKLQKNMALDISYFKNSNGELEVCSLEQASLPAVPEDWQGLIGLGKFKEVTEGDICIISIEDKDEFFWTTVESIKECKESFKDNEIVVFNYYVDEYGRRIIVSFEK